MAFCRIFYNRVSRSTVMDKLLILLITIQLSVCTRLISVGEEVGGFGRQISNVKMTSLSNDNQTLRRRMLLGCSDPNCLLCGILDPSQCTLCNVASGYYLAANNTCVNK